MKKTTLRLSNRVTLYIGISAMTFFFHSKSFTQTTEVQKSTSELRAIEVPQFANESERQEWILKHPEEYRFLTGQYKEEKNEAADSNGFPQFVNTGDPEKDGMIYQERKQAWIIAHPEEYKQMIEKQLNKNK